MKDENINNYRFYEFIIKSLLWVIVIIVFIMKSMGSFDDMPGYQQNLILALDLSAAAILSYFMPSKNADRKFEKALKYIDKDNDKAVGYLEEYLESKTLSDNDRKYALRILGGTHYKRGDYDSAIAILNKALEEQERDDDLKIEILGVLGIIYSESGDLKKAVEHFDKTFDIIFSISKAYIDKAILMQVISTYIEAGQKEKAVNIYDRLLMIRGFRRDKRVEQLLYGNPLPL